MDNTPLQQNNPNSPSHNTNETPAPQKSMTALILGGLVLLILGFCVGYYVSANDLPNNQHSNIPAPESTNLPPKESTFCTMEAKICADGSGVGRIPPSCEFAKCPEELEATENNAPNGSFIVATDLTQVDEYGDSLRGTHANILIDLSDNSTVDSKSMVTINGEKYEIKVNQMTGLCGMVEDDSGCGYDDEKFPIANSLRVWKNTGGVIGLNLIAIEIEGYYLDSLVVTKYTENEYVPFTSQEVMQWKQLLQSLRVEKIAIN